MVNESYPFGSQEKDIGPLPDGIVTELEEWQADVHEYFDGTPEQIMHPHFGRVLRYDLSTGGDKLYGFEPASPDADNDEPRMRFSVRNFPQAPVPNEINWGLDLYTNDKVDGFVITSSGERHPARSDIFDAAYDLFERYIGERD